MCYYDNSGDFNLYPLWKYGQQTHCVWFDWQEIYKVFFLSYIMKKKYIYLESLVPRMLGCLHVEVSGPEALKWLYQNAEKK